MDSASTSQSKPDRQKPHLSAGEKKIVLRVYESLRKDYPEKNVTASVEKCSQMTGVSARTIYRILRENRLKGSVASAKTPPGRPIKKVDDDIKYAIRRKLHSYFFQNKIPTIDKLLADINNDNDLPNFSRSKFWKILKELNIRYLKRNRKSHLIEKTEIVMWRRMYLNAIQKYRAEGREIFYLDETWLNEGHTQPKVWQDLNVKSQRQAFMDGWSIGLKNPTGKGKRLIITHIGGVNGFVEDGLLSFESKKTGDYHEEMNSEKFENWFKKVLTKLPYNSVVVLDNAPYHSRRLEKLPTTAWRKMNIQQWLSDKCIPFDETMVKCELLNLVKQNKQQYIKYVVDEMAREKGVHVLRLPPYHCELNPIELIWGQVKNEVARKNTTFKLAEVKELLVNALEAVNAETWQKAIQHVIKEEVRMIPLDVQADIAVDNLIISTGDESGDDSDDSVTTNSVSNSCTSSDLED